VADPSLLPFAAAALAAAGMSAAAGLRAWQDWIALRREQVSCGAAPARDPELTALRARVRRLEAIASGIEL
jgi:hypothetical protein